MDDAGSIYGIINYGISNSGSGSVTGHGDMVAGVGNAVSGRTDLLRTVRVLREMVDRSADELSTTDRYLSRGAIEEIDAELRKETPERSRLVEGIERLKASARSVGGLLTEAVKLGEAIGNMFT
ncbi:hypothetical protein [Actinophytocola sp.]|uniref:hypothetical protein n=1 Tax=Actinophytocola sp. TaxID=1872138 RepID=UPI003899C1A9